MPPELPGWHSRQVQGTAQTLSAYITDIAQYDGAWWIANNNTWLRITDAATITKLQRHNEWTNPHLLRDS